jgi:hypothetical protein
MAKKEPVISVDCKKKEIIGNYKNPGREWEKSKMPLEVKEGTEKPLLFFRLSSTSR